MVFKEGIVAGKKKCWDLIIVGAGPAGLAAGIYAARAKMEAFIVERFVPGGQIMLSDWVENYPGFPDGISGMELMDRMRRHAENMGMKIVQGEAKGLEEYRDKKVLYVDSDWYETRTIIIATGTHPKNLGVPGEEKLTGKGVSYCATCDGPFYKGQTVAVVGGGDTAVQEALFLTKFASKVYLIHRRDKLRAAPILQERLFQNPKIEVIWDTVVVEILGDSVVEGVRLKNVKNNTEKVLKVSGVFVFIGVRPNSAFVRDVVDLDFSGFIITNENLETNIPGVYAAGDVRRKALRQVVTACSDGATAVFQAQNYIARFHEAR